MSRLFNVIITILTGIIFLSSCDSRDTKRLYRSIIVFPDTLELILQGKAIPRHIDVAASPNYKLIILIDSLECSYCKIQKTQRFQGIFEESVKNRKFDLITILSPKQEDTYTLREFLLSRDFSLPIYLDAESKFPALNPGIPCWIPQVIPFLLGTR